MAAAVVASPSAPIDHVHSPSTSTFVEADQGILQHSEKKIESSSSISGDKGSTGDACQEKKRNCAIEQGDKCSACRPQKQGNTCLESSLSRKRNLAIGHELPRYLKRKSLATSKLPPLETTVRSNQVKAAQMDQPPRVKQDPVLTHGIYTGVTTEADPELIGLFLNQESASSVSQYHKHGSAIFALDSTSAQRSYAMRPGLLESLSSVVGPFGQQLVDTYQRHIEVYLPILEREFFEDFRQGLLANLDPVLLAAVYAVALAWLPQENENLLHVPDLNKVKEIAFTALLRSLQNPSMSSVQAGVILMQMPGTDTKRLNSQLINAAYELGLHLDCTEWDASDVEKSLRRRLAWSLYVQDKWCSLIHGRPSLISYSNWAVGDLSSDDFATEDMGMLFRQMVGLTKILATILNTFYTLEAMQEVENSGTNGTRLILERAKPVQIRLKEWFGGLPSTLKIDASNASQSSATGFLHLAYFAAEITLHRCIIRSLRASGNDEYLTHICRSAAKTRLISAMDFVNRLRTEHLRAFWYFPSQVSFALIGSFGFLLLATGPSQEEVDFYRTRLGEFRWTLSVSSRSASFLLFAVESLDSFEAMLRDLPEMPRTTTGESQLIQGQHDWHLASSEEHGIEEDDAIQIGHPSSGIEHQQHPINTTSGLISPSTSVETASAYEAFT